MKIHVNSPPTLPSICRNLKKGGYGLIWIGFKLKFYKLYLWHQEDKYDIRNGISIHNENQLHDME